MTPEEVAQVKTLCRALYRCLGRSTTNVVDSPVVRIAIGLGRGDTYRREERIDELLQIVTDARLAANEIMSVLEPDGQAYELKVANDHVTQAAKDPTSAESREAAMKAAQSAADHDLDIIRVRKLFRLAIDAELHEVPHEARNAASAACVMIVDRGLMLGPKREKT